MDWLDAFLLRIYEATTLPEYLLVVTALTVFGYQVGYRVSFTIGSKMPYGAPAPLGTVFWISLEELRSWPSMREEETRKIEKRCKEAARFCR